MIDVRKENKKNHKTAVEFYLGNLQKEASQKGDRFMVIDFDRSVTLIDGEKLTRNDVFEYEGEHKNVVRLLVVDRSILLQKLKQ